MSNPSGLEIHSSRLFESWLAEQKVSLAFTTYQAGKLFFVGIDPAGRLAVFNRTIARVMGLAAQGDTLWVATLWQLWRFENALKPGEVFGAHDRYYVPQLAYTTGDIDVHDVGIDAAGDPIFVSTLFSCLARPDARYSFIPVWKPPFVSRYAAEDRCHMNGLAMADGAPAYVTCVARSDANEGWREHRTQGGIVVDVKSGAIVCEGLSMPHSPRMYRGRLWVLNSGTGEFGYVDLAAGRFEPVAFCAGYLRGMSFCGDFAVVGLSRQRQNRTFNGLLLDQRLAEKNVSARCGLAVIDLKRGDVVHELRLDGVVEELFDTAVLPGVCNPAAVGFMADDIKRTLSLPPDIG
ncbi:TIGR03032 family protein [Tahibacter amnicola]|uniref:TIGR03032 family protein n=1 Tax=Tahibacter amnicola TaxID=2976241 RepID=A0ABY6BMA1_9GAMM|nr:TIGR03032 family protein [Tahibacter amnicola]UXI69686.1 TIGR03032 family protein [Tahibacter amnicola]